jgi:formylglycine-generating enzyme required for sulfatase activity
LVGVVGADLSVALAQERIALVIGNSNYQHADALPNPQNDAAAITEALEETGFEVFTGIDLDFRGMQAALRDFGLKAESAQVALVYYAGHGIQVSNENYLLPVDTQLRRERDLIYEALPLSVILGEVSQARNVGMVILDACRDNPLAENLRQSLGPIRSQLVGQGLGRVEDLPPDTLIAYSTRFNQLAVDGAGNVSPFTEALVKHIREPGLELNLMFRKVRDTVLESTAYRQEPRTLDALGATPFYFTDPRSNQAPEIANLEALQVTDDASPTPLGIIAPTDPDDDPLRIEVMGLPTFGRVAGETGVLEFGMELTVDQLTRLDYEPIAGKTGKAGAFLFVVRDGQGGITTGRVPITVIRSNEPPVVAAAGRLDWPAVPLGIEPPSDPDGDDLNVVVVEVPTVGEVRDGDRVLAAGDRLSVDALSALLFEPKDGAAGSFTYEVADNHGGSARSSVAVALGDEQVAANATTREESAPASTVAVAEPVPTRNSNVIRDEAPAVTMVETVTSSNIRNGPDVGADWLLAVPGGTPLKMLGQDQDGNWYEIETATGETGFISSRLVRPIDSPNPELAALVARTEAAQQGSEAAAATAAVVPTPPTARPERTSPPAEAPVEVAGLAVGDAPEAAAFTECKDCPTMVALPPGSFQMGSTDGDPSERPVRPVTVNAPFAIGMFEVTVAEWRACAEAGACRRIGEPDPTDSQMAMQNVSWSDARAYAQWLASTTGQPYRLPSEAEWEYAARGGSDSRFWWGDSSQDGAANCSECGDNWDRKHPAVVGSFAPNPYGLHDMNGGVSEWVADCWFRNHEGAPSAASDVRDDGRCMQRVLRGGSWRNELNAITAASRYGYDGQVRYYTNGFRVARDLQ